MTKSPRKNVPDVGIELGTTGMPSELASDRATAPGEICAQFDFKYFLIDTMYSALKTAAKVCRLSEVNFGFCSQEQHYFGLTINSINYRHTANCVSQC